MGRPIKQLFIGNRNPGGVGGEGVADVTIGGTADVGIIDQDPLVISAPDLAGGVQAAGYVVSAAGDIDSIVITEAGSGYLSAPTVTVANQTNRTLTAVLTTGTQNAIACTAFLEGGSNLAADIIAQKGATTYRVQTADGIGECSLVAATPSAAGEMAIVATDSAAGTYWVTKLYNNTCILTQNTGTEFADGAKVKWADTAVLNESVAITN